MKTYRFTQVGTSIPFRLMLGGETIIEEDYQPNADGVVEIDLRGVISQYVKFSLLGQDRWTQTVNEFSGYAYAMLLNSFKVIPGGVRKLSYPAANWLMANWLTWQPQTKKVRWHQPEYLSYYYQEAGVVKACFYPKEGDPEEVTLYSEASGQLVTYNMEMAHLFSLSSYDAEELYGLVDVWVEDAYGVRLTYVQRYVFTPDTRDEHYFVAANSVGGLDTFCFTGARTLSPGIEHETAEQGETTINLPAEPRRSWSQNTGYLSVKEAVWVWEFLSSSQCWALIDDNMEEIVLDSSSIQSSDKQNLTSFDFAFELAEDGRHLRLDRNPDSLPPVQVASPAGEIFFLAPRVVDFQDAVLADSTLFLVQQPYLQKWTKTSLGALAEWIANHIGGVTPGTGSVNYVGLQAPEGMTVEGSPVTSIGTLKLKMSEGYRLPTSAEIEKGVSAFSWGNHRNVGYVKMVNNVAPDVNGNVDIDRKIILQPAPQLMISQGINEQTGELDDHKLVIMHPALGILPGAEAVLMIYRKCNKRIFNLEGATFNRKKKGWAVALGNCEFTDHAAFTLVPNPQSGGTVWSYFYPLQNFIVKRFCYHSDYSLKEMFEYMTYSEWVERIQEPGADFRGFLPVGSERATQHFGIAVRIPNPAFTAKLMPGAPVSPDTQEIDREPRYFYSNVAPLRAHLLSDRFLEIPRLYLYFGLT